MAVSNFLYSGSYKLLIDHPNYHLFKDSSIVIKDKVTFLGLIELDLKSKVLDEVVIKDNSTMRVADFFNAK